MPGCRWLCVARLDEKHRRQADVRGPGHSRQCRYCDGVCIDHFHAQESGHRYRWVVGGCIAGGPPNRWWLLLAGIIREASEAIRQAPALICFPLVPFVLLLGLVVYWIVAGAYISSMASFSLGDLKSAVSMNSTTSTNSSAVSTMDSNDLTQYFIAYHFFGLLWTNQVIQAISMCTIAGVVCQYYWSRQKEREGCGGLRSIARSFKNCSCSSSWKKKCKTRVPCVCWYQDLGPECCASAQG
jgi:hypothetical protein